MPITFFGASSSPADNGTQNGPTLSVTPPASMLAGDLVLVFVQRRANSWPVFPEPDYTAQGGQRWSSAQDTDPSASGTPAGVNAKVFWCCFNGTWSGDPSWRTSAAANDSTSTLGMTAVMLVFRPDATSKWWVPCIWPRTASFVAGTTPFTKTITGLTTVAQHGANSHIAVAAWFSADDNTWDSLSGTNWTQSGLAAQYRNLSGSDLSVAFAYQIQSASGATTDVSLNQATLGGAAGATYILAFTEVDLPAGGTGGTANFVQSEIGANSAAASAATVTLPAAVANGNSVVGAFSFEHFDSGGNAAAPIFPMTDDQGNELFFVQSVDYGEFGQIAMTWFRPAITNAPTTFDVQFASDLLAWAAIAHEINGGVELHGFSGTWGFPGDKAEWTPLSAGSVTTTTAAYVFCYSLLPGTHIDPPHFDYTAWSGTKREEIGNDSPAQNTTGSGDLKQGAAGAINVTDSSSSSVATILMMVALAPAAAAPSGINPALLSQRRIPIQRRRSM